MQENPKCTNCQHYYITWDKNFPYGCKAMGFKSFKAPNAVVRESSGQQCLGYAEKQKLENRP